jgi:RHS repeat-associated protein
MSFRKTFKQAMVAILSFAIAGGPALAARTTTYFHTDRAGSVVAMTNEAGVVLGRKDYAPFGEQIQSEPVAERTSYTGKQHDDVIGLTYFGARWFDPEIGRFTGVDPVSFVDHHAMSFNRYLYAFDNPYKFVDPDGEFGFLIAAAFILVGLVASDDATPKIPGGAAAPEGGAARFAVGTGSGLGPLARGAAMRQAVGQEVAAGGTITANRVAGEAFERQVVEQLSRTQTGVVQQVTVRTSSGVRTRLDALGRDASGAIRCTECKSSATASLTKNQSAAFPEIKQSGAVVVGRGKPGFPGGTQIPPTKVDVIRP